MVTAFCLEGEVCVSTTNRNFNGIIDKGGIVHLMSTASAALIEALFLLIAAKVKK